MSDETDRQDLEDRVDQLESTISQMLPSRRDALKLGGAALVGGAAMSGSASAGTQQAGTIGTANDPVDVESEDISNADTITTDTLNAQGVDAVSVSTDKILNAQGSPGLNFPGSGFQTISSSLDTILFLELFASNSSNTSAKVVVEVDTNGDSTAEFSPQFTPPLTGTPFGTVQTMTIPLPAGGQIKFDNQRDPNGSNQIFDQFFYSTN